MENRAAIACFFSIQRGSGSRVALAASGSAMKLYLRSHDGPFQAMMIHASCLHRCLIRREWFSKADANAIYSIESVIIT